MGSCQKNNKTTKITKNTNEFIRRFFIKQAESNNKHHKEKFKQKKDITVHPLQQPDTILFIWFFNCIEADIAATLVSNPSLEMEL